MLKSLQMKEKLHERGVKMFSSVYIGFKEGLIVTVFSMAVVFAALMLISFTIDIMRIAVNRKCEGKH